MGLITKEVTIVTNSSNYKHYVDLGYATKCHEKITIPVKALTHASTVRVEIECDNCHNKYTVKYHSYVRHNHDGLTYCNICSNTVLHSRENNPLWNPNKTDEERNQDRTNKEYKLFLNKVLYRDNYTCRCCGTKSTKDNNLIVHHLDGYNWCIEKRTDDTNGITLCENCHKKFHGNYGHGNNTKEQFEEWIGRPIELLKSSYIEPIERKIYCLEENKIYESCDEFCKEKGVTRQEVKHVCNINSKSKVLHGFHLFYLDVYENMNEDELNEYLKLKNRHKVVCLETTKIYNSIRDVCKEKNMCEQSLIKACQNKIHVLYGCHWRYLEDYEKMSKEEIQNVLNDFTNKCCNKVICVETNEKFDSITKASEKYSVHASSIGECCRNEKRKCKGYHWRYLEDYEKMSEEEIKKLIS